MEKYLENWKSYAYEGNPAERLEIDDNFSILVIEYDAMNILQVRLKDGRKTVLKFNLFAAASMEKAKREAIARCVKHMHETAIKFSYGATNLRVLTGVNGEAETF